MRSKRMRKALVALALVACLGISVPAQAAPIAGCATWSSVLGSFDAWIGAIRALFGEQDVTAKSEPVEVPAFSGGGAGMVIIPIGFN